MPVLHMDTEAVRGVGNQLGQTAESLRQQSQQLRSTTGRLMGEWQGGSASMFESEMATLLQQVGQSAEAGVSLHQRLDTEIAQWIEVADGLGGTSPISNLFQSTITGINALKTWADSVNYKDLMPHTVSSLLQGQQYQLLERYRSGDMTWDEMLEQLEDISQSLVRPWLQTDTTLYQIAEGQGEIGSAIWEGEYGGDNWNASVQAGSVTGQGNYNLKVTDKGIEGKAQGEIGIYAVRGEFNADIAGANVAVDGYIGAEAKGEAGIVVGASGITGAASASAFVGGRVDGSVSKEAEVAGVKAKGEARGSVSYGAGIKAEVEGGFNDGVLKLDADLGATLGFGAEIGFSVELDVSGAVDNIAKAGDDAIKWGTNTISNFGSGISKLF